MKIKKITDKERVKAKWFADYFRNPYNEGRHIAATLGSAGYIYRDDIQRLVTVLIDIGESGISEAIMGNLVEG